MVFTAPDRTKKISDSIINQIRDAVMSGEYKLGDKIGSEKDLMSQLNVSKATLREALRVLEAMGIVQIRKGLAGGVFVAEVDMKTTLVSILNFLNFQSVSIQDITMVRYILEPAIIQIAAPLVTEDDIRKIEEMIQRESDGIEATDPIKGISFHRYLARITHNPILILIMDFIDNLVADIKTKENFGTDFYETVTIYHHQILDCIRQKNATGAIEAVKEDILFVGRYMAKSMNCQSFEPSNIKDVLAAPSELPTPETATDHPKQSDAARESSRPPGEENLVDGSPQKILLRHVGSGKLYLFERDE